MQRKTIITHNGVDYEAELGRIERTMLGFEDHGFFTFGLSLDFGGSGTTVGNFALDTYDKEARERVFDGPFGMVMISEIMKAAGAREWEHLRGMRAWFLWPHDPEKYSQHNGFECVGLVGVDSDRVFLFQTAIALMNEQKVAV